MDYAEKILRKYGWNKGKGLGRNETGISKPIKCGLKFDKSGIGYNEKVSKDETNRWWEQIYNKTASQIFSSDADNTKIKTEKEETATILTDEELFAACGGRTAHRAARHGLKLNGKLDRIEEQEKQLTPNSSSATLTENLPEINRKEKKMKRKNMRWKLNEDTEAEVQNLATEIDSCNRKRKKKIPEEPNNRTIRDNCNNSRTDNFRKNKKGNKLKKHTSDIKIVQSNTKKKRNTEIQN